MRSVWLLAPVGLMCVVSAWAADADGGSRIPAVWKEQHLSFTYSGRTSRYSCDGLRDKVRALLLDLGARRDLRIAAIGCERTAQLVPLVYSGPSLTIVVSMPALPDAKPKPLHRGDLMAVDARFEAFTITNDVFRNLGMPDCELVQEFARQILPKFVTRDLTEDISCVPFQQGGGRFRVRGEVLRALPPAQPT
jgi:hypothetical protein